MKDELAAALVNARVLRAALRLAGMNAANRDRRWRGETDAYDESAFLRVIDAEQITEGDIARLLTEAAPPKEGA